MARLGLLEAVRQRVAARGMTLTELARAADMQPGNLRRMLMSTTASPRLESVMRLLPPLQCQVGPAGARTAPELMAFLDTERQRQELSWEQLLSPLDLDIGKATASLARPDRLSLDVVTRLAAALHIDLELIDDPTSPPPMKRTNRRPKRQEAGPTTSTPRPATVPAPAPSHEAATTTAAPTAPPTTARSTPQEAGVLPSPAPAQPSTGLGLPPLRPPRLGRYQASPPTASPPRQPPTWSPPERSHTLESAALAHLAEVTSETWADGFTAVLGTLADAFSLPSTFLEKLGRTTFDALQRFRRKPRTEPGQDPNQDPGPPPGCFDALDAMPLAQVWLASKEPDYRPRHAWLNYDQQGVIASNVALDDETATRVRLSPQGSPHRLIQIVHAPRNGPRTAENHNIALTIKVDGEPRPLTHVRAGPVFGELIVGERVYLVAAISSLLAVIEVQATGARTVWGGRAAALPEFNVQRGAPETEDPADPRPAQTQRAADEHARQAESQLATERAALADERRAREAAEQELEAIKDALVTLDKEVRAELTRQAEAHAKAEHQAAIAREMLGKSIEAYARKNKEYQEAVEQRQAAEEHAAQAEAVNRLTIQVSTKALDHTNAMLVAEAQRANDAEQAATTLAARLIALEAELAGASHAAAQQAAAEHERTKLTERLLAVEAELSALQKAQADDAAALTRLIEANRIPEAITYFVTRALGTPVDDIDQALTILEQQRAQPTPEQAPSADPPPPPNIYPASSSTPTKPGRNEPCPCGSGKKYKRCCLLTLR